MSTDDPKKGPETARDPQELDDLTRTLLENLRYQNERSQALEEELFWDSLERGPSPTFKKKPRG